jgi:hypothetical protein
MTEGQEEDKMVEAIGLVNHVWLSTLADEKAKKQVGLNHVSHMWDQHRPYWYLWFDDCPGVYKMELQNSRTAKGYDWLALFTIKYYPTETEPSFNKLSTLEKLCRTSDMFHSLPSYGVCDCPCQGLHPGHGHKMHAAQNTGAPDVTSHDIIPAGFFYAGDVRIAFNERTGSMIRLESQTSWKTVMQSDFTLHDDAGGVLAVLKKGEPDKDYPGFTICNKLYRRLVASWSRVHHYILESESARESDGVVFLSDGYAATPATSTDVKKILVQSELRRNPLDRLDPFPGDDCSLTRNMTGQDTKHPIHMMRD